VECLHLGGIGVTECDVEASINVDDSEDIEEIMTVFGGCGAVVSGDGQGIASPVSGVVTGDAFVLKEQDEQIVQGETYFGVGVESFDGFVADLEAKEGFEEYEELFDVSVTLVQQSGEEEKHGSFREVNAFGSSCFQGHAMDQVGSLVHIGGEVAEALFDPFALVFPCSERVGGTFITEALLFDRIEHFDEVLCHPFGDPHRGDVSRIKYLRISKYILIMRRIKMTTEDIILTDQVETFYEKNVTAFGNSAKVDAPKKYIGRRAYVIILKE